MDQLLSYFLTLILVYGYPIVFLGILLSYMYFPIPLNALVLAAGAFTKDGTLNMYVLIPLVSCTSLIGDVIGYYLGKRFGFLVVNRYTAKLGLTQFRLETTHAFLDRWGASSIFMTRWLITPLGNPLNLIAGIHRYPFKSFFIWAAIGELVWASIYVYLGHFLGTNWVAFMDYTHDAPTLLAFIVVGVVFLYLGYKMRQRSHQR